MRGQIVIDDQHVGLRADQADRREILFRVEADLLVQAGIGGEDRVVAEQQRVAIGRRVRHDLARDIAACPRRLSTTNGCPSRLASLLATIRARMSLAPPGGKPTTIVTGRTG